VVRLSSYAGLLDWQKHHVTFRVKVEAAEQLMAVTVSLRCVRFWCGGIVSVSARPKTNRRSLLAFCFLWLAPFLCRPTLLTAPGLFLCAVIHGGGYPVCQGLVRTLRIVERKVRHQSGKDFPGVAYSFR